MRKNHIKHAAHISLTSILAIAFMLSGLLYTFNQKYQRIGFAISIGIFIVWLVRNKKILIKRESNEIIYYLFVGSFFLDAFLTGTFICFVYGIAMLLVYMMSKAFEMNGIYEDIVKMYKVSILFYIILIAMCLLFVRPSLAMYKGILGNPNTLGIAMGGLFVFCLAKQAENVRMHKRLGMKEIIYMCLALVLTVLSSCRIAILGEIVCVGIFVIYYMKMNCYKTKRTNIIVIVVTLVALVVLAYVLGEFDGLNSKLFLFQKSSHLQEQGGNIGNGRFDMWNYVLNNAGVIGNGKLVYEGPVHNVYFGLMNQWGKLNGILFFLFISFSLCKTCRFAFAKKEKPWSLFPFLCTLYFFCVSMTENYLMTAPMTSMFMTLPLVSERFVMNNKKFDVMDMD